MKKLIIPIGILLVAGDLKAQLTPLPTTENYVQTKTYLDYNGTTVTKSSETVQYFDGLGRPKQVVGVKASPLGKDVVTHIEYDPFGRPTKDFLPIPQSGTQNGAIYTSPLNNASSVYGSEKIYSEKILENSPLDRIQQQIQVGNDWTGKPVKFEYDANIHEDYVRKYETTTTWVEGRTQTSVQLLQYFLPAQLYKNTVIDEDGNKTIEFKNGQGQTLLVRKVISATENADTYYVYNEYNQLAFVIPPMASAPTVVPDTMEKLYYQYRYDGRGRLVEKKLPGKGWEYMVYDIHDRLVAVRDANMEAQGQWLYTKYDQYGRVAFTGTSLGGTRSAEQALATGFGQNNVKRISTVFFTRDGLGVYYDHTGTYPNFNFLKLLSVNYYDTYPAGSPPVTNAFSQPLLTDDPAQERTTKGLPTASYVKNMEDDGWTMNYTWYDTKGRVIGSRSKNHLGGYTILNHKLDFAGVILQTNTYHRRLMSDTEKKIVEKFTYDPQNRLLTHTHQVDANPVEYLTRNKYNEISQLENKKVGGVAAGTPLQQIDYKYNIRGWMTQINDPDNLSSDLFGYKIRYQNPVNTTYALGRHNGNISEVDWKTSNDGVLRRYSYSYDALNRLNYGHYSEPNGTVPQEDHFGETAEYDLNGNITRLYRNAKNTTNGLAMQIDNLSYTYTGNRLLKVTDASQNYLGYSGGGNTIEYDPNGNMTSHMDKGIALIKYNYLNLPNFIIYSNIGIGYTYRADGVKVKKLYGSIETNYLEGFQYDNSETGQALAPTLKFVPTAEGYFDYVKNKYIYNYTDHLGNIRLSYFNNGSSIEALEENNYYPFGLKYEGVNVMTGNMSYQYKYNGKELQETGMYDYGA
ncbi:DUF6443 domain-containing protein, partial [Chryseobacterium sp.]|uniref:DUF6443 domain-containing protein n=1 Tax=Chryseobacterium sp. TaxID=1871047 RepID=UPI00333E83C2